MSIKDMLSRRVFIIYIYILLIKIKIINSIASTLKHLYDSITLTIRKAITSAVMWIKNDSMNLHIQEQQSAVFLLVTILIFANVIGYSNYQLYGYRFIKPKDDIASGIESNDLKNEKDIVEVSQIVTDWIISSQYGEHFIKNNISYQGYKKLNLSYDFHIKNVNYLGTTEQNLSSKILSSSLKNIKRIWESHGYKVKVTTNLVTYKNREIVLMSLSDGDEIYINNLPTY